MTRRLTAHRDAKPKQRAAETCRASAGQFAALDCSRQRADTNFARAAVGVTSQSRVQVLELLLIQLDDFGRSEYVIHCVGPEPLGKLRLASVLPVFETYPIILDRKRRPFIETLRTTRLNQPSVRTAPNSRSAPRNRVPQMIRDHPFQGNLINRLTFPFRQWVPVL
jgi:hypothetical protein